MQRSKSILHQWVPLLVILTVYACSFLLPAICDRTFCMFGYAAFVNSLFGGKIYSTIDGAQLAPFTPIVFIGWLPNPLCWAAIAMLHARRWAFAGCVGAFAFLLALSWVLKDMSGPLLPPERQNVLPYYELRIGYYVWLSSMALIVLAAMVGRWARPGRGCLHPGRLPAAGTSGAILLFLHHLVNCCKSVVLGAGHGPWYRQAADLQVRAFGVGS
jgi:hypothetical protein